MTTETITRVRSQTLDDFRALPEGTRAQLIDGEILMSPAPTYLHQRIVSTLLRLIGNFVMENERGEVLTSPLDVHLAEMLVLQPDVVFVSNDQRRIIEHDGLYGAPDLVVEVLSPSTAYFDLTKKREAYERFGVWEYWIVDPERQTVEVLALEEDRYVSRQTLAREGSARSVLLDGFTVDLAALFTLPGAPR